MPNTHSTLTSLFSDIADAIRAKDGSSADIVADSFPTAISNIPTGVPLPQLTEPAAAGDILSGKEALNGQGAKLTGTLNICDSISVDELYLPSEGVASMQVISTKDDSSKIITWQEPDALPENIVAGKAILGVTGTYEGGGAEHNSGTFTMAADRYSTFSIEHGLSKKPKLFVFHMDGYQDIAESTYNIYCLATPEAAVVIKGTPDSVQKSAFMTTPYFEPSWTKVFLDATAVTFGTASYNWKAGDYVWEAWTW